MPLNNEGNDPRAKKRTHRFHSLCDVADSLIDTFGSVFNCPESVELFINKPVLAQTVASYFNSVDSLKIEERYPDGGRINFPKVAALTAVKILEFSPIRSRGKVEDLPKGMGVANAFFARDAFYHLVFVKQENVPDFLMNDLTTMFCDLYSERMSGNPNANIWKLFFLLLYLIANCLCSHYQSPEQKDELAQHERDWRNLTGSTFA